MTALITVYSGGSARKCDARCHEAVSPRESCECVCAGALHGVGRDKAETTPWEVIEEIRECLRLGEGEAVQLRIGA